jgi:hypothetical protein
MWRVGFNGASDTAVVYAHNQSEGMMGEGSVFLLEKTAGRWTVRLNSLIMVS